MRKDYYVYIHRRKDNGVIFYVGKGTRQRLKATTGRHNKEWFRIVEEAGGFIPEKLYEHLNEEEAYRLETEFILNPSEGSQLVNKVKTNSVIDLNYDTYSKLFRYDPSSPSGLSYIVNEETQKIQKRYKKDGDPAGFKCESYWKVRLNRKIQIPVHRVIWLLVNRAISSKLVIDHINGNGFDNNISNLREVSSAVNARNTSRTNKDGSGVFYAFASHAGKRYYHWSATWMNLEGIRETKSFSINKYGYEEAYELARNCRLEALRDLNSLGAGYNIDVLNT